MTDDKSNGLRLSEKVMDDKSSVLRLSEHVGEVKNLGGLDVETLVFFTSQALGGKESWGFGCCDFSFLCLPSLGR